MSWFSLYDATSRFAGRYDFLKGFLGVRHDIIEWLRDPGLMYLKFISGMGIGHGPCADSISSIR